ncbi:MAG TPA: hypothetical protein VFC53_13430 [Dehalococcoidia bacterium]|nr:hypothetical protein [Dehalococcoidia bacterium]
MTIALRLTHDEPRLVYLALVYHLGRPGSELDPATVAPSEHGLRSVKVALERDLAADDAVIELDEEQYRKLLSAIYGSVNELRVHHMRGGGASTVERFSETARSLFPDLAQDPARALDVAEAMIMLHRRIERAVARAAEAAGEEPSASATGTKRGRWPFRRARRR